MGLFDFFKKKKDVKAQKYNLGMEKTRKGFLTKLKQVLSGYDEITEDLFDDLTDVFIMADIGVETTLEFIEKLKQDIRVKGVHEVTELQAIIVDKMLCKLHNYKIIKCGYVYNNVDNLYN